MNACRTCHAGCCRSFAVPVTGSEILRLMRGTGLPFEAVADRWPDPADRISRGVAPHWRFEDSPETPWVLALKHRESGLHQGTSMCGFLTEFEVQSAGSKAASTGCGTTAARCSVYEQRPLACRLFPFARSAEGAIHFPPQPAFGRDEPHTAYRLCPHPESPDEATARELHRAFDVAAVEMAFFRGAARIWNAEPRPWSMFPDFLEAIEEIRAARRNIAA